MIPVEINRIPKFNVTSVKTAAYNAVVSDLIPVDATAGTRVITLPTDPQDQAMITIKMIAVSGAFVTTINTGGTNVFNKAGGSASLSMSLVNQAMILQFQASTGIWFVISDDLSLAQLDLRFANLNSPVFTGTPTAPTPSQGDNSQKIAPTNYVDLAISNAIAGVNPAIAVTAATTSSTNTSTWTYNNGVGGIGATWTGPINTAITIDGFTYTAILTQSLLVKNDTQAPSGAFNGIFVLSALQTIGTGAVFTRRLDYDTQLDINNTGAIPVVNGTDITGNKNTSWVLTSNIVTVGTDSLTYQQFTYSPTNARTPVFVRETMVDADKTFSAGYTLVSLTTALTSARVLNLPAANSLPAGSVIRFADRIGGITTTNTVTITRAGADTINVSATTFILYATNVVFEIQTDGISAWTGGIISTPGDGTWSNWTVSYTGFSANPSSVTSRYFLIGKMCTVWLTAGSGTSNATTFTITLPFAASAVTGQSFTVIITDSVGGTSSAGRLVTRVGSNVADVYKTVALGAFTNSGTKNVILGGLTFEIA